MSKNLLRSFTIAAVAGAIALSYWAGSRSGMTSPATASPAATGKGAPGKGPGGQAPEVAVEVAPVATVRLPRSIATVGSLRSDETIVVRPEVAGRVAVIGFAEGESVAEGALLLKLDDSVQRADVARAEANLVLSKSKFERAADLRQQGFISGQAKDEAENNLRVAQADAELARARLAKTVIRAPFAGVIGLRHVSLGDYVKEGQDVVNLEKIDPVKVDFRVPEIHLAEVRDRQVLQITLDAVPGRTFEGRVYAINPLLDASGRAVVIRATVPNARRDLRPGMFARVRLFTTDVKDSLAIPEESLFPVGDDQYVYRVVDGRAVRQKVETGQRRDGVVEITNGLAAADRVVTAGQMKLRDGAAVRIAEKPAAVPPAAGSAAADAPPGGRS